MSKISTDGLRVAYAVGDKIRAYDFQPLPDRKDRYAEGYITAINDNFEDNYGGVGYAHYLIAVTKDTIWAGEKARTAIHVPFQTTMDWDGRISLLEMAKKPVDTSEEDHYSDLETDKYLNEEYVRYLIGDFPNG